MAMVLTRQQHFDDLVNNMPQGETLSKREFPNGFEDWHETHYVISTYISKTENRLRSLANRRRTEQGMGGLCELAKELTDEFEKLHEGRLWDGEWIEELEDWLASKDQSGN